MRVFHDNKFKFISIFLIVALAVSSFFNYKLSRGKERYKSMITAYYKSAFGRQDGFENRLGDIKGFLLDSPEKGGLLLMSHDLVGDVMLTQGVWEPHISKVFEAVVKPGSRVLVLGGHVGVHVLTLSRLASDKGKLFVFEANPHTLNFLRANLAFNAIQNVSLYPKAAYSENKMLSFVQDPKANSGASHIARPNEDQQTITVEAVAIDSLLEIDQIDVLQMDIEGAEPEAVYGAQKLIDRSPNLVVIQEWSPQWMSVEAMDKYLQFWHSRGYEIAQITPNNGLQKITDDELKRSGQIDLILSRNLDALMAELTR